MRWGWETGQEQSRRHNITASPARGPGDPRVPDTRLGNGTFLRELSETPQCRSGFSSELLKITIFELHTQL